MFKKHFVLKMIVLATILSLVLTACGGAGGGAQASKVATFIWTQEFDTLNPMYTNMWFVTVTHQLWLPWAWENVKNEVRPTPHGFLVFDDTVIDKNYSRRIELVRSQYSGNAHGIIKGIGVVTCVYVNPQIDQFWIIDYRIYDPEGDGKTKLEHMLDMLLNCVYQKSLDFWAVLMDTWYATKEVVLQTETLATALFEGINFKGDFLKQKATRELFSTEQHLPSAVIDRDSIRGWQQDGGQDTFARAKAQTSKLLKEYQRPQIALDHEKELRSLVERLSKEAGMDQLPGMD